MKILIVEDNVLKLDKISSYIKSLSSNNVSLTETTSYNSALNYLMNDEYDFLILDMSIPTFDRNDSETGGRVRVFGGKEIIQKVVKKKSIPLFVVVTGYTNFSDERVNMSFEELTSKLEEICSDRFKGMIVYEASSLEWQVQLNKVLSENFKL